MSLFSAICAHVTTLTHLAFIQKCYLYDLLLISVPNSMHIAYRKDLRQTLRHPSPVPNPKASESHPIFIITLYSNPDFTALFTWLCYWYLFGFTSFVLNRSALIFKMSPSEFSPKVFHLCIHKKTPDNSEKYTTL